MMGKYDWRRWWLAGVAITGMAGLAGCQTTVTDAHNSLISELTYRGTNPYIEEPAVRDMENRMRQIVLAADTFDAPFNIQFNPRNVAILNNFSDQYSYGDLMRDINLARAGFDQAAGARYPQPGTATGCQIATGDAFFIAPKDGKSQFDWAFVRGDCENGMAHGIGEASDAQSGARFIGRFDRGMMVEGVASLPGKDGSRMIQTGGIAGKDRVARLLISEFQPNGYQWHRFGDFDAAGQFDGFGINIWGYTNKMVVRAAGHFRGGKSEGFLAEQQIRDEGEAKVWNTWIGMYRDGKLNGLGAWSDGVEDLRIGEWKDGVLDGVVFGQYASYDSDYHEFFVGRYVNGKKHGPFKVLAQNSFVDDGYTVENYNNGSFVENEDSSFDFGQMFALAAGTAIIGSSGISDMQKVEIGGAFAADVLGNSGGGNMARLQQNYQIGQMPMGGAGTPGGGNVATANNGVGGGALQSYRATITCDSGTTSQIDVPYRTESCRVAAVDFATTYACNKLDQDRVARNCQSACGNAQCLQQ